MSAGRWTVYSKAKKKLFNGSIKLGVDVFKILLVQTTSNFATLTLSAVGSLTNQIASAGGYTQQGLTMTVTWTVGASAGAYQFSMSPLIQTATGAAMVNIRAAVIKNSAGQLLCFATMTANQFSVSQGQTITLAPTAGGIFTLSSPISPVSITPVVGALGITGTQPQVTNGGSLNLLVSQRPMTNYGVSTTGTNFFKEFGAHFRQSDVPLTSFVEWRLADGTTVIPSQADNRAYWPDGSLRCASFTMKYPNALAASASATLKGYSKSGTFNNTSWTNTGSITGRDIRMEITISGTTYTLSANNEVTRGTNITQIRSGAVSAAWRIWGEFRNGTGINSTPQGSVWGILYLTFFSDGTYSAWGTIQPNRWTQATSGATVNSASVTNYKLKDYVGPTTLFDYSTAFTLYAASPVYCCNTDGLHYYSGTSVDKCVVGYPTVVLADTTTTGLYDSMAIWWYKSTATMIANLPTGTAATYIPNSAGNYGDPNQTGGNQWIGPTTEYAVTSMLVKDWISLRADRVNAFDGAVNQIAFNDFTTSYPGNLSNGTTYAGLSSSSVGTGWGFAGTLTINGGNGGPAWGGTPPWDGTHAPLYAWWQYLVTGQEPWLDILHEQTIGFLGAGNPGGAWFARNPTINSHPYYMVYNLIGQTRGVGWNNRNVDNSHWVTPDSHPMKPYLADIITQNWAALADYVTAPNTPATAATLGVYDGGEDSNGFNSGWMHDYLLTTVAMAIRRGRITTSQGFVTFHVVPWILGRAVNGCIYGASQYQIGLAAGQGAPTWTAVPPFTGMVFPQTWADVWTGDNAWPVATPYGSACPASGVANLEPGFGNNYLFGLGHSYPNIEQVAAVCAQIAGVPTASTVATYLANYETTLGLTEANWGSAYGCHWRIRVPA